MPKANASSQVTTITPEAAKEMLALNTRNRQVSPGLVKIYARDMAEGRWVLNGDTIRFSREGQLLDGQHRLLAVIRAGVPVPMMIVRGLEPEVFDTIDAGRKRSAGDIIAIEGGTHHNLVAATARVAFLFSSGRPLDESPSRTEITAYARANAYLAECVAAAAKNKAAHRLSVSALGCVGFLGNQRRLLDADLADFLGGLDGVGLERGDPRLTLRDWAVGERLRHRGHMPTNVCFSAIARAWTAHVRGETLMVIKVPRGSPHWRSTTIAGFHYETLAADAGQAA